MGSKGDIDLDRSPTEPQDDYAPMNSVLSAEFPVFDDGAGEVEEIPSGLPTDAGLFYFQSSYVFNTLPGTDGYFGFSNDVTYNDKQSTLVGVVGAGDYFIDFTQDRVYSFMDNFSASYVHLCPNQLLIRGSGPLVDALYEQKGVLFPTGNTEWPTNPPTDSVVADILLRWGTGHLLAYIVHGNTLAAWDRWPGDTPGPWNPSGDYQNHGMWYSTDDGQSWSGASEVAGANLLPVPGTGWDYWRNWLHYPTLNITVEDEPYGPVWLPIKDRNHYTLGFGDIQWSQSFGANWEHFWSAGADAGYHFPVWANGGYWQIGLDQRWRLGDPLTYVGSLQWMMSEGGTSGVYPQLTNQLWYANRFGLAYHKTMMYFTFQSQPNPETLSRYPSTTGMALYDGASYFVYTGRGYRVPSYSNTRAIMPLARHKNKDGVETILTSDIAATLFGSGNKHFDSFDFCKLFSHTTHARTSDNDVIHIWTQHDQTHPGAGTYYGNHLFRSVDAGSTWEWMTDPALGNNPDNGPFPGAPFNSVTVFDMIMVGDVAFGYPDVFIVRQAGRWFVTDDGGYTWAGWLETTSGAAGLHSYPLTDDVDFPYPDPSGTKWPASDGNVHGVSPTHSNFIPEMDGYNLWSTMDYDAGGGARPVVDGADLRGHVLRVTVAPGDFTIYGICDEAGFIIRESHPRDLKRKLLELNSRVFTRGSNGNISFEIVDSDIDHGDAYVEREVRSVHYEDLKTVFDSKVKLNVPAVAGGAFYTDELDLTDPEYYIEPPVANAQDGPGGTPTEDARISIRTLISMRKIIQALYADGWFCACYSYCPCQTDIAISGEKK